MNTIQKMMIDTGMLEIKLPIKHDTHEYDIDLNKVACTYCGELESQDEIHIYGDTDMCEACYQNMVE